MVLARHFSDDASTLRQIYWGSLLHDIGKIGTPDAITSNRSYRKGLSFDSAEIRRVSGSQLDLAAVEVFLQEEPTLRRMVELKCTEAPPQDEPVIAIKE